MMICEAISIEYQNVMDGWTDRQTECVSVLTRDNKGNRKLE